MRIANRSVKDALLKALADEYSIKILLKTIDEARSVEELSETEHIPISTAYRRVNEMKDVGLLTIEKAILTGEGKKFELYRSVFKAVHLDLNGGEVIIDADLNEDAAMRLTRLWATIRAG